MLESTRTILALSGLPKVGRVKLRAVLQALKADSVKPVALPDVLARFSERLPSVTPSDIDAAEARADDILEQCSKLKVAVHVLGFPSYPSQLERLKEPPAFLFSIGTFEFGRKPRIAVVGTRKPTEWGLQTAKACAAKIVESHGVVVSGLALGIDAAAQEASVEHDGPTWAILAHGLHTVSPSSNRDLAKRILDKGGALVSEYPPGEKAQRHYFVERDRIQAGLSDAVLVIESGVDGGAMHTVRFAEQAHVHVWATFPNAKMKDAEGRRQDLPEPQQGTWTLLHSHKASHVATPRALDRMIHGLALDSIRISDSDISATLDPND